MAAKKKKTTKKKIGSSSVTPIGLTPFTGEIPIYPEIPKAAIKPTQPYYRHRVGTTTAGGAVDVIFNENYPTKRIYIHHIHIRVNDSGAGVQISATISDFNGTQQFNGFNFDGIGDSKQINVDLVKPLELINIMRLTITDFNVGGNPYTVQIIGYLEDI